MIDEGPEMWVSPKGSLCVQDDLSLHELGVGFRPGLLVNGRLCKVWD